MASRSGTHRPARFQGANRNSVLQVCGARAGQTRTRSPGIHQHTCACIARTSATVDSRSHASAHRNLRVHMTSRARLLVQGRQPDQTANAGIAAGFARPARNRSSWRFRASRPAHWLWGASLGEERRISCPSWLACVRPSGAAAHLRGSARVYSITACQSVELGANSEMEPGQGPRACDPGCCQCQSHPPSAHIAARHPGSYVPSEGLHAKI